MNGAFVVAVQVDDSGIGVICFFWKQKTAYELRSSYWSSDVFSADLLPAAGREPPFAAIFDVHRTEGLDITVKHVMLIAIRSEERRVGTECVSTCRSRWSPSH